MADPRAQRLLRTIGLAGIGVLLVAGIAAAALGGTDDEPEPALGPATTVPAGPTVAPVADTTPAPSTTAAPASTSSTSRTPATTAPPGTTPAPTVTTRPGTVAARVQVKFVAGSGVRLRDGTFVSLSGHDVAPVRQVLARSQVVAIERLFQRPEAELAAEKAAAEARTGQPQPDLNLYYLLSVSTAAQADALVTELGALAIVEKAYRDPGAAPPPAP